MNEPAKGIVRDGPIGSDAKECLAQKNLKTHSSFTPTLPSFLLTESGDHYLTETGLDSILLD